jgi:hypothetical protein
MRKATWVLTMVAGLVMLFQAGTTVAYADDARHVSMATQAESNTPLTALEGVFISVGVWLLGRPPRNVG